MIGNRSKFRERLLTWYRQQRRDLPWRPTLDAPRRQRVDPYLILVSELMLQQTQVSTVVPYFNRFIARFPTIQSLAEADEQDVLRLWQGLGYYSRARNLHAAANQIAGELSGAFPRTAQQLRELPGVGPARKRLLLSHFGTPERFLAASREDLEAVPGLPGKTARDIYEYVNKIR